MTTPTNPTWPAVPSTVTKHCDNACVGVVITDTSGRFLLFKRATLPVGIAPVAGHVDEHGTPEQAAIAEVREEVGLHVTSLLRAITRWRGNICRRQHGPAGPGHLWTVYGASVIGTLQPEPREAAEPAWYTPAELQNLANTTVAHAHGQTTARQFAENPSLEPVWVAFFTELGVIHITPPDLAQVDILANASPYRDVHLGGA
jgi:8-oxo-dGTP pyrophosphatase MutT (NUDIX family)